MCLMREGNMPWSQNVYSTMVSEVGYDDETRELSITWAKTGQVSIYSGVPEDVALRLANAPSVGTMVHEEIKPFYQHRYR